MGLQLKYNGYTFNTETTLVPMSRVYSFDARGRRNKMVQTWSITTIIEAATETAITTAIDLFESKMVDDYDLILYQTNGTTPSSHEIDTDTCVAGVQIHSINYPQSSGVEYANRRTATVEFSGTTEISTGDNVLAFQESVSIVGTGDLRWVAMETMEGNPRRYTVADKTLCYATQTGSAVGRSSYPTPPSPLWAAVEHKDRRQIVRTPIRNADASTDYTIQWTYAFTAGKAFNIQLPGTWI